MVASRANATGPSEYIGREAAGTTIEAVRTLEECGFRSAVIEAMKVCEDVFRSM